MSDLLTVPDAERAYVGSLLHGTPEALHVLAHIDESADFTDARLAIIVTAVRELLAEAWAVVPDPTTIAGHLRHEGRLSELNRPEAHALVFIAELHAKVSSPRNAMWYAADVIDATVRRRVYAAGQRLQQAASTSGMDTLASLVMRETEAIRAVGARRRALLGRPLRAVPTSESA